MKRLSLLLISLLFIMVSFVGCTQSVTETGNPCPLGDCAERPSLLPEEPGDVQDDPPDMASPGQDGEDEEEDDLDWYDIEEDALYVAIPDGWILINQNRGGAWQSVTFEDKRAQSSNVVVRWHELDSPDMSAGEFANIYLPGVLFLPVSEDALGAGMLADEFLFGADGSLGRSYLTVVGHYGVDVVASYYSTSEGDVAFFLTHIVDSH